MIIQNLTKDYYPGDAVMVYDMRRWKNKLTPLSSLLEIAIVVKWYCLIWKGKKVEVIDIEFEDGFIRERYLTKHARSME